MTVQTLALTRRSFLAASGAAALFGRLARAQDAAQSLVAAARAQIGVTTIYDPAYVSLDYPMGDVPRDRGVCTDVVIRAFRDALSLDLQQLVHEDMRADFGAYPAIWGLKRTDRNIDHRRVPNLMTFFSRKGASFDIEGDRALKPGDLVTMLVPPALPHIVIVSDRMAPDGTRPLVIHNIGGGTQEEDRLAHFEWTGWYRFSV